jgi:hypothetical protein
VNYGMGGWMGDKPTSWPLFAENHILYINVSYMTRKGLERLLDALDLK